MKDRLHWVPSFVTGAASATTATVAVALLLYSGEGMLKSLILIVAFELAALGLGLGFGVAVPTTRAEALVSLRRRWLSVLVAFLAASFPRLCACLRTKSRSTPKDESQQK